MTTDTIELPTIEPDLLDEPAPAPRSEIAVAAAQAVDLERLDLTSLAIAKFGDWRATARSAEQAATAVHDLSTATKCKEVRKLRERIINVPLADARKIEKTLKSKLTATSKAVGGELTAIETEFTRIDRPFLENIEAAEKKIAEAAEREKARKQEREDKLATIAGWVELAAGKSAADIAKGLEYAQGFVIDATYWAEFEARARAALADTITALQELHAAQIQREQEAAELAQRRAEAEAMARAMEALQDLQQYVTAAGEVDSSAKVRALIDTLEAEQVDAERFGALLPAAIMARDWALATMRTILADVIAIETAEAEAERKAAEEAERARLEADQRRQAEEAAAAEALQCAQETKPPADADGTPAAVAAVPEAAPLAAGEPENPALEREAGPITPHTEESGSSPADAPAPGTPGSYASSGAQAAQALPSGDEGTGAHADDCAPSPAQDSQRQESGVQTDPNATGNGTMARNTDAAAPVGGHGRWGGGGLGRRLPGYVHAGREVLTTPPPGGDDGPLETSEHEAIEPAGPLDIAPPTRAAADLADLLGECQALVDHLATAFEGRFPSHPKPPQEWWTTLRAQLALLAPRLAAARGD